MATHIPAPPAATARPTRPGHGVGLRACVQAGVRVGSLVALMTLPASPARAEEGEVTKVDRAQGRISLKHGPIRKFDLPAMTMSYRLADPHWADRLKPGDQVHFEVERLKGYYTITRLSPAP